ncbi:hypothetical protein GCM10009662_49420 [Catellatospora coxensis]|uniref:Uncharacterized protein n=1 Tax=Catellatospora coxensis TaxID=310354 RepID=A0A8J3P9Q8_9ACTN|nr:hypothetical protein Cco03nite_37310 [Catellatospora coxensis]
MSRLRREQKQVPPAPQRLPLRWAVIAIVSFAAGLVGYVVGGPVSAIVVATTVVGVAHKVLD